MFLTHAHNLELHHRGYERIGKVIVLFYDMAAGVPAPRTKLTEEGGRGLRNPDAALLEKP